MLSLLLCCAAVFVVSTALPGGAPDIACGTLTPSGPHGTPSAEQTTSNPWTIDICEFDEVMGYYTYTPGNTYSITLRPAQGANVTLRGFFIQGRTQLQNAMVGSFYDPSLNNNMTRLSSCTPPEVGVTHNNPDRLDQSGPFTFTWTAPEAETGPVWFYYTIVQNVSTWWANDTSAIVQEVNNLVFPNGALRLQGFGIGTVLLTALCIAFKALL